MKCALLLTLVVLALVGFVAGDGAWQQNKVYTYKLVATTFKSLPESNNEIVGVISRAYLSIRSQSDDLLIGQITQAEYGKKNRQLPNEHIFDLADTELENWSLNKPFQIHLENGVIRSLSVDEAMTNYEVNQLKVIVSQFQVDANAQNKVQSNENKYPEINCNDAYYKTMEPIVTGSCETMYDISAIPNYLIESQREWLPLPELKETGDFIQIVKTRNSNNCHETGGYLLDIAGRSEVNTNGMRPNEFYLTENSRIVISGSQQRYTIQSSVTVNKVINGRDITTPLLTDYVNVTLESVEESAVRSQPRLENLSNLKNIGNLVYNYDSDVNTPLLKGLPGMYELTSPTVPEEHWTSCWTLFPASSTLCRSEFTSEYVDIKSRSCGFLGLGKQALCRMDYPGCRATPCYSVFIPRSELCERTFKNEFPVTKGGFEDCAPGFYRSRCCPRENE